MIAKAVYDLGSEEKIIKNIIRIIDETYKLCIR